MTGAFQALRGEGQAPNEGDATQELYLQPGEVERRREQRAKHHATATVPAFRAIGFAFIAVLVVLHNAFVPDAGSWSSIAAYVGGTAAYCILSWIVLRALYGKAPVVLPAGFMVVDVMLFTTAVYVTGGATSWLFPLVIAHVADQVGTTFRRVLAFAHLAMVCYLAMIAAVVVQGGAVVWPIELVKCALLYAIGIYTSFTALTAERLRGRLVETVRFSRDLVIELEHSSQETQRALHLSEAASRSKSEFLANMSHELRTPLNSVIGFADILLKNKKGNLGSSDLTYLGRIRGNGSHLLRIIDDILDLSRIEAGRPEVRIEDVSLGSLVAEVIESMGSATRSPGVDLVAELPPDLAPVRTDRTRLRQILTNLVGNALKFTSQGSVRVRVTSRGAEPLAIEVIDTGIGIPADRLAAVFRPFEQADNTTSRKYGGTGLGLSISRSLCAALGFRLEAESEEGRGSTFRVVLG